MYLDPDCAPAFKLYRGDLSYHYWCARHRQRVYLNGGGRRRPLGQKAETARDEDAEKPNLAILACHHCCHCGGDSGSNCHGVGTQQTQGTGYMDIAEVRTVTGQPPVISCLLLAGCCWVSIR